MSISFLISWMFAYVQTHQIVPLMYVQFFVYQLHLNKGSKRKRVSYQSKGRKPKPTNQPAKQKTTELKFKTTHVYLYTSSWTNFTL